MKRAYVIGDPVEHSLSPVMQEAAMRAAGIDASYELWPTPAGELSTRIEALRGPEILGANVTVPHKQAVMPLVDKVTATARRIGAVNTLIPRDGSLLGDNTDAIGFQRSLEERGVEGSGSVAVILGAGGAARAIIVALEEGGYDRIVIANRTAERATALAGEFDAEAVPWEQVAEEAFPVAALVVNATSLGWHDEMPIPEKALRHLAREALVADLTYRDTAFLQAAAALGHPTMDGLGMLIHQGARAFELWTGVEAPVEVMREAVVAEQARRAGH